MCCAVLTLSWCLFTRYCLSCSSRRLLAWSLICSSFSKGSEDSTEPARERYLHSQTENSSTGKWDAKGKSPFYHQQHASCLSKEQKESPLTCTSNDPLQIYPCVSTHKAWGLPCSVCKCCNSSTDIWQEIIQQEKKYCCHLISPVLHFWQY